jgi:hypothetical protein
MHQPVDKSRGQGVVHVKEFAPIPEGSIRDDHDRSQFTTGGDNLEQQIGSTLVDGQIVRLIEEENTANQKTLQRQRANLSLEWHQDKERDGFSCVS